MRHVAATIEVASPVADVWPLLAEFRHWPEWGPSIRSVDVDVADVAPGVLGRVQTAVGVWLPFEITDVERERFWHWKVAGLPATRHTVAPLTASTCRVEFSVSQLLRPYVLVLRVGLRRLKALAEER